MRSLHLAAASTLASVIAGIGHAAEHGVYVGASAGTTETSDKRGAGEIFDEEDSGSKVMVGWRAFDWFAIEGSRFDLGEVTLQHTVPDLSPFELEQTGYDVFSVFLIDIATFDLFAKAGVVRSSADLSMSTIAGPIRSEDTDTDFAWGAGAQVRFGKVAARIEYERFEISNGDSFEPPTMISLGVIWTF